jgi:hypothetical protein
MYFKKSKISLILVFAIFLISLFLSACEETPVPIPNPRDQITDPQATDNIIYAPDGKGYLKIKKVDEYNIKKRFMHLEGTAYEMGYQHGYLIGESVERTTTKLDFYAAVMFGITGEQAKKILGDKIIQFLLDTFFRMTAENEQYIPEEFREEMHGIADGATAAGYNVTYEYLLLNNLAFDILLGVGYPYVTPFIPLVNPFTQVPHMCDGFIISGNATTDGRTLMGRDWMFTDKVLKDESLIIEYVPADGYKFVTPSLPGWVGLTAGMNSQGIGIGMDMVPSIDSAYREVGMGVILNSRKVLQHAGELSEALTMFTDGTKPNADRDDIFGSYLGVPWAVAIGDGYGTEIGGAVVETSADEVMFRHTNYKFPENLADINGRLVPQQIEDKDDVIVYANHWIIPYKSMLAGDVDMKDSVWRYGKLVELITAKYGQFDQTEGRYLIDHKHPPAYEYYGTDPTQPVKGITTLFDLTNREMWSLYGNYDDPWVTYKFK